MSIAEKCYVLMPEAEYEKMRSGADRYDTYGSAYARNISGAKASFRMGKHTGRCVIVCGDKIWKISL